MIILIAKYEPLVTEKFVSEATRLYFYHRKCRLLSCRNTTHPWLPEDADETFDPLDYADVTPSRHTPLVVTPRGGDREVGRSCYQVDTQHGRYLVDCGLNQGTGEKFPDFRGLQPINRRCIPYPPMPTSTTAVGCQSSKIEISSLMMLPSLLPHRRSRLPHSCLRDSLKIHRRETDNSQAIQQFTRS